MWKFGEKKWYQEAFCACGPTYRKQHAAFDEPTCNAHAKCALADNNYEQRSSNGDPFELVVVSTALSFTICKGPPDLASCTNLLVVKLTLTRLKNVRATKA